MQLTSEQNAIVEASLSGNHIVIEAGAGTGKTSTLVACANALPPARTGLYLAFNKSITEEAKTKFPRTVRCSTAHALAMSAVRSAKSGPLVRVQDCLSRLRNSARVSASDVAAILGIDSFSLGKDHVLPSYALARIVLDTVANFARSADETPNRRHMPTVKGLDIMVLDSTNPRRRVSYPEHDAVWEWISDAVDKAWSDLTNPDGKLRYDPNVYLKCYELTHPRIEADFIFFDEAQDANSVMANILASQFEYPTPPQLIVVGDSAQAIYGWNGAVDAIARFKQQFMDTGTAHSVQQLTQSWRFGDSIAAVANRYLSAIEGNHLRLTGNPAVNSRLLSTPIIDEPITMLSRTNANVVSNLMEMLDAGIPTAIVGGRNWVDNQVRLLKGIDDLFTWNSTRHPELSGFSNWADFEMYVNNDAEGSDLRPLYNLYEEHGFIALSNALEGTANSESDAMVVLSTAHKAKGREWDNVSISSDFTSEIPITERNSEALQLLYVASTRAKYSLDVRAILSDIVEDQNVVSQVTRADSPVVPMAAH